MATQRAASSQERPVQGPPVHLLGSPSSAKPTASARPSGRWELGNEAAAAMQDGAPGSQDSASRSQLCAPSSRLGPALRCLRRDQLLWPPLQRPLLTAALSHLPGLPAPSSGVCPNKPQLRPREEAQGWAGGREVAVGNFTLWPVAAAGHTPCASSASGRP